MLHRLIFLPLLIVSVSVLLWFAWLVWQNDLTASQISSAKFAVETKEDLDKIPPLVIVPLRSYLVKESQSVDVDVGLLSIVADEYISRRPLDPQGWLWSSDFRFRLGDVDGSREGLTIAHGLSKKNPRALNRVFNRYLELGLVEEAMPVAHDLALARPASFRKLFYLMVRLNSDYASVVEQVIPKTVPGDADYKPDLFFSLAILDAIRAKNAALAKEVWNSIPSELRANSGFGKTYLNYLARLQDRRSFKSVWNDLTGFELLAERFPENTMGLELVANDTSPCFQAGEVAGAVWRFDTRTSGNSSSSVLVEFAGEENAYLYQASCYMLVEPNGQYALSLMWSGDSVTTLSGPFVEIDFPGVEGKKIRSEMQTGTWPWQKLGIEFDVPGDVSIIRLRLRRDRTSYLDNKIAGRVWFDDFKLTRKPVPQERVADDIESRGLL